MLNLPPKFPLNFTQSKGSYKKLLSPNDQKAITEVQYATPEDIELILSKLKTAQNKMRSLKAYERADILKKTAASIKENAESLAMLIATEGAKPLTDAKVEVARSQTTIELCAEETLRLDGESIAMERTAAGVGHINYTSHTPIGPVLAISAFNHPLNLLAHQLGCAIAAGCAVVLKPSSSTPLCAFKLEKMLIDAGLPKECLFVVNCEVPLTEQMAESLEFGFVSFIGSAKVGWNLRRKIANGTRLSLEHGGQAFAVVTEDADLTKAIPSLIQGGYYHAGQVCISTQRIFVHDSKFESFCDQFVSVAEKLVTGDARDEKTKVGPLIKIDEAKRVLKWISDAEKMGARIKCGGHSPDLGEQYILPTVLTEVPIEASIMTDEVFGPVVCINSYENEEELVEYLNANNYIFESCIFTENLSTAMRLTDKLESMTIIVNNHSAFRVDRMPFGGHKLSGLGMGGVKYSINEMTRIKQVIIKG